MNRVGRDRLEFLNIKKPQRGSPVSEGDTVAFVYGEIDCRAHVMKQVMAGRNHNDVISVLVYRYFDTILLNRKMYKKLKIIVVSLVPPKRKAGHPIVGTKEEQLKSALGINTLLKKQCDVHGFIYLDVYTPHAADDGMLNEDMSDGNVHVLNNKYVKENIKKIS